VSLSILLAKHPTNSRLPLYSVIVFSAGFLIEVLGVATGFPFGTYYYGDTLGWALWNVPLVMGVNWLMLTMAFGIICNHFFSKPLLKVLLASAGMVLLDGLIEPIAIKLDYWVWPNQEVPIQNYLAWFAAAFLFQVLFQKWFSEDKNYVAIYLIISQITYFSGIYFFL